MVRWVALCSLIVGCGYDANFEDCAIACPDNSCPSGLVCGANGLCRSESGAASCGANTDGPDGDSSPVDGAEPGDGMDAVTEIRLSQTPCAAPCSATATSGDSCFDGLKWFRVFPLAGPSPGFGINGSFTVTKVSFWVRKTQGSGTATIVLGLYDGSFPSAAFERQGPDFHDLVTQAVPVGNVAAPGQLVEAMLDADFVVPAGGRLAVGIEADTVNLGASGEAAIPEDRRGYHRNNCNPPGGNQIPQSVLGTFIIEAVGHENP